MTNFSPKNLRRFAIMVGVSLLLFAAVVGVAGGVVGFEDLRDAFAKLPPESWVVMVAVSLLNYVLRGARWPLGAKFLKLNVPVSRMALIYVAGYAFVPTPGKIGTALRLWLLKRDYKVPIRKSMALMVMDQLTDFLAMIILIFVGFGAVAGHQFSVVLMAAFVVGFTAVLAHPSWAMNSIKWLYKITGKRKPRLFASLQHILRQTAIMFGPKVLLTMVGLSLLAWVAAAMGLWWMVDQVAPAAVAQAAAPEIVFTPQAAGFAMSFASIAGILTMLPGGLGGTEASLAALLTTFGLVLPLAMSITLVFRGVILWLAVGLGIIVLPMALKKKK